MVKALELGAIDFVAKPKIGLADGIKHLAEEITDKIRMASKARIRRNLVPATAAATAAAGAGNACGSACPMATGRPPPSSPG